MSDRLAALCTSCGLCCDGTLFTQVPLLAAEAAQLRGLGLVLREADERPPALPQRCAALAGTRCTIYAERPASCRRYRCMLYSALEADEVGLDEALARVRETHGLLAALAAALPPGPAAALQRARAGLREETLTPEGRAALDRVTGQLGRHFERAAGRA